MTNREKWAKILPLIQAFVNNVPIQRKDFGNRWRDTEEVHSVLCNIDNYRIKPDDIVEGIWSIEYSYSKPGEIKPPKGHGKFYWRGTNQDTPPWHKDQGYTYDTKSEKFVPDDIKD